jgi:hypothetical protein
MRARGALRVAGLFLREFLPMMERLERLRLGSRRMGEMTMGME